MSTENENTEANSELTTLRKHNADLTKDLKALRVSIQQLEADKETAKEEAENASADEVTRLKNQLAKSAKDLEAATKRADDASKSLITYKSETELNKIMIANKVQSEDAPMVMAYLKSIMSVDTDGTVSLDEQPVEMFAKSYFSGAGKRYVAAPDNSGGGAAGSDGTKPSKITQPPVSPSDWNTFDGLPDAERNALAENWGRPDLRV